MDYIKFVNNVGKINTNNGSLEDLLEKVKTITKKENIL